MSEIKRPTEQFQWEHDAVHYNYQDAGLTGYTGLNYNSVAQLSLIPAIRAQIGERGYYKTGLAALPDDILIASPVDMLAPKVQSPFPTDAAEIDPKTWPVKLHVSRDKGESWQAIEHTPLCGKEGFLQYLDSGVLLFRSEEVDGIGVSEDLGRNWKIIHFNTTFEDERERIVSIRAPIIHSDGTVSMVTCIGVPQKRGRDGKPPSNCRAWLIHSTDGGRTWNDRTKIQTYDHWYPQFWEADFERMPDGRILACARFEWTHPLKDKALPHMTGTVRNDHAGGHMMLMESADEGLTWSEPREFLQYSEVHGQLTLLSDGRLLCTYTHYHLPFGVFAVVSNDYGRTWDFDHPIQLALSNAATTGWATTRELSDGTLVTVYALGPYHVEPKENGRTVCHSVRWSLPPTQA